MQLKLWCCSCQICLSPEPVEDAEVNDLLTVHALKEHKEETLNLIRRERVLKGIEDL